MKHKYIFAPIVLLIIILTSLMGGTVYAQVQQKNKDLLLQANEIENANLITVDDLGDKIKIEQEGELFFINHEVIKDLNSTVEIHEGAAGEQVIVLQTRIVLDEQAKSANSAFKNTDGMVNTKALDYEYLKFYPNPSNGKFNIAFQMAGQGDVDVRILNMLGNVVYYDKKSEFENTYQKSIDLASYGSGNYILQIIQNDRVISRKIVIE